MTESRLAQEQIENGTWLFRWRSYVPLLLLPLAVYAIWTHPESIFGPRAEFLFQLGCLLVSCTGILVRAAAIGYAQAGTSGRNTKQQVADHLNTAGMYSICRHPLYLGNILIACGTMLFTQSLLLVTTGLLAYWIFYEKITATEEDFIAKKFGGVYQAWAARTPYLIPRLGLWRRPELAINWRAAFCSEAYSLLAVVATFAVLDAVAQGFRGESPIPQLFWSLAAAISFVIWFVARFLRKYTTFLK